MEHIAAILLLVGCSDGMVECRELPAPVALFEIAEECEVERPRVLLEARDSAANVFASCIAVDPADEEADAELVWEISASGMLVATLEPSQDFSTGYMIAAGSGDEDSVKQ